MLNTWAAFWSVVLLLTMTITFLDLLSINVIIYLKTDDVLFNLRIHKQYFIYYSRFYKQKRAEKNSIVFIY